MRGFGGILIAGPVKTILIPLALCQLEIWTFWSPVKWKMTCALTLSFTCERI